MKKISMLAMGMMMMASCATAQDIQLPAPHMNVKMTLMETLQKRASQREYSDREISDATLSQVLWAACGINRPESKKRLQLPRLSMHRTFSCMWLARTAPISMNPRVIR